MKPRISGPIKRLVLICFAQVPFFGMAANLQVPRYQGPVPPAAQSTQPKRVFEIAPHANKKAPSLKDLKADIFRQDEDSRTSPAEQKPYSKQRLQLLLKTPQDDLLNIQTGGGGVVDGGGGNTNPQTGELLDREIFSEAEKLEIADLRNLVHEFYKQRLQVIETQLPGFTDWLLSGFRKSWYLTDKPFHPKRCPGLVCQNATSVFINGKSYLSASPKAKAGWVLKALLGSRLLEERPSSAGLDARAEGLFQQIINTQVSGAVIYQSLRRHQLLDSDQVTEVKRVLLIQSLEERIRKLEQDFDRVNKICASMPVDLKKSLQLLQSEYRKATDLCLAIRNPQSDGAFCDPITIQRMLEQIESSPCKDSSLFD